MSVQSSQISLSLLPLIVLLDLLLRESVGYHNALFLQSEIEDTYSRIVVTSHCHHCGTVSVLTWNSLARPVIERHFHRRPAYITHMWSTLNIS